MIKFVGKRAHIKHSKESSGHVSKPVSAPVAKFEQVAKPLKPQTGVDFSTLKGGAWFGRPMLSAKEIEAIETGGANVTL
jgi:hypothetical protein